MDRWMGGGTKLALHGGGFNLWLRRPQPAHTFLEATQSTSVPYKCY